MVWSSKPDEKTKSLFVLSTWLEAIRGVLIQQRICWRLFEDLRNPNICRSNMAAGITLKAILFADMKQVFSSSMIFTSF